MRAHQSRAIFIIALLFSLSLVACFGGHHGGGGGGGGNGGGGNGGGSGTAGTVTLIQPTVLSAQVVAGSGLSLQAAVHGGNGTGVNWGVQQGSNACTLNPDGTTSGALGTQGGSAALGTVPLNTVKDVVVTYTPPNPAPASPKNVFTITALQAPQATGPCIVVTVLPTNNSLLTANLVFRFRGFTQAGLTFAIIGRFTADGSGHITNGLEDVNIAQANGSSVASATVPFTGTYSMANSSYGTMQLTVNPVPAQWATALNPPPTTMNFSFVLSLDGTFGNLIETDGKAVPVEYIGSGDFQI